MPLTKLSLGGNNDVMYTLFPPRESLVSDIPAGDGNIEKLLLQCSLLGESHWHIPVIKQLISSEFFSTVV
jgi:hypothetical protein